MSAALYSTNPSLVAALAFGAPALLAKFAPEKISGQAVGFGWGGVGIGVFLALVAICMSWDVGDRFILLHCPIIVSVGTLVGALGWWAAGKIALAWANGIILLILVIVSLYAATTKRLE